tara:strand:+ start:55 stop:690 length:636 start_codon:yes stop_codon:yes gene_type:complete
MRLSESPRLESVDLGRLNHLEAEKIMLDRVEKIARGEASNQVLFCELDPIITVGRAGAVEEFAHLNVPVQEVSRGGKATFHGLGQMVAYPLIHLAPESRDLHAYLYSLEEALIQTVNTFGLIGVRDKRNTGCWVKGKKIGAVGVAVRRWVTYHGVSLNVTTDLSLFRQFHPCGLEPDVMTSLEEQLESAPLLVEVKSVFFDHLKKVLSQCQ